MSRIGISGVGLELSWTAWLIAAPSAWYLATNNACRYRRSSSSALSRSESSHPHALSATRDSFLRFDARRF